MVLVVKTLLFVPSSSFVVVLDVSLYGGLHYIGAHVFVVRVLRAPSWKAMQAELNESVYYNTLPDRDHPDHLIDA